MQLIPLTKVTAKKISWKEGEGANGKWHKIGILVDHNGEEVWIGGFESKYNSKFLRDIQEGSQLELIIEKNGEYYNFRQPNYTDHVAQAVIALQKGSTADTDYPRPEADGGEEPNPEDIPF